MKQITDEKSDTINTNALMNPASLANQFLAYIAEYRLPVRQMATMAGIPIPTLYSWMELSFDGVISDKAEAALKGMLARLRAAEELGLLDIEEQGRERMTKLTNALSIESPAE